MEKIPLKSLFKNFPFIGVFLEWDKVKRIGKIIEITSDVKFKENERTFFTHISCRFGDGPIGQLINKRCLFALGASPKIRNETFAIKWILEENIDGEISEYGKARKRALDKWKPHQLISAFKANWYLKDVWKGEKPTKSIKDPILLNTFEKNQPIDPVEYIQWIRTDVESPFHLYSDQKKEDLLKEKLDILLTNHDSFFSDYDYKKIKSFVNKIELEHRVRFNELIKFYCKQDFFVNAVALDIECNQNDEIDEANLYQLGYVKGEKVIFLDFKSAITPTRKQAYAELGKFAGNKLIIGHNVIGHDLVKLRKFKNDKNFLSKNPVWDTMLFSMLLEPWKSSHALTSSIKAHKADEDAKASQNLFKTQLEKLPLDYLELLQNSPSIKPAEILQACAKNLTEIDDRKYPQLPDFIKKYFNTGSKFILPEILLHEVAWVPGLGYQWPDDYASSGHFPLNSKLIESEILSKYQDDPLLILLLEILRDSERNSVQVLKGMLPILLQEKYENLIQNTGNYFSEGEKWTVTTYEACLNANADFSKGFTEIFPALKVSAMVKELKKNAENEISKISETFNKEKSNSYRLEECHGKNITQFLGADFNKTHRYWVEYHPARAIKKTEQKWNDPAWKLFDVPHFVPNEQQSLANTELTNLIYLRWLDQTNNLPIDVLWPTTAKRFDYWKNVLEQLISLNNMFPEKLLILLVEHKNEIESLTEVLAEMKILAKYNDTVAQSFLAFRKNNNHFCSISSLDDVYRWKKTAAQLEVQICFLVTALPLGKWVMCTQDTDPETTLTEELIVIDDNQDMEEEPEDVIINEELSFNKNNSRFSGEIIDRCLSYFLPSWVHAHFGKNLTVILDQRISILGLNRYGVMQDCVKQDLNQRQCKIFNQHKENFGLFQKDSLPSDFSEYETFLHEYWGYEHFKETTQKPAIESIHKDKGNLLVKLPTGEGKSVIFQVPALLHGQRTNRLSFVITPLKALMKDQVNELWSKGLCMSVDYLSSDRDYWQNSEVYQGIIDNRIKLLYVSPERFRNSRFNSALQQRSINDGGLEFAVIDETHCVSQWGFEFRPDYFFALGIVNQFCSDYKNPTRMLLLSATVTDLVQNDLKGQINDSKDLTIQPKSYKHPLQDHIVIHSDPDKDTIYGSDELPISRAEKIIELIEANTKFDPKKSILLIFVSRKKDAENITYHLQDSLPKINTEFNAEFFHAGLPSEERQNIYESVQSGKINVLVATKAFGMGMDIQNIHWCIHFSPPSYLEDFLQEVGRTGRDERKRKEAGWEEVEATLLFHQNDFSRNHRMVQENMIKSPELILLWENILENCFEEYSGNNICILSTDGFPGTENFEMKGDRLGKALSWFERKPSNRMSIQGMIPDMVTLIQINRSRLIECGKNKNNKGSVASAILKIYNITNKDSSKISEDVTFTNGNKISTQTHQSSTIWRKPEPQSFSLASFLNHFVGFLFKRKTIESESNNFGNDQKRISNQSYGQTTSIGEPNIEKAEISISSILSNSKLPHKNDIFRVLWEMQQDGLFRIHREIEFVSKRNSENNEKSNNIWKAFETLIDFILPEKNISNLYSENFAKEFSLDEMKQIAAESVGQDLDEDKVNYDTQRTARSAVKLLNVAGLRIREVRNKKGAFKYELPIRRLKTIKLRKGKIIHSAKEIEKKLKKLPTDPKLSLSNLLEIIVASSNEMKLGIWDLENALRLLSSLNLYHTKQSLTGFSYVLEIKDTTRLLKQNDQGIKQKDKEMFEQLEQVNRFAELRSFSMELFTLLPSEQQSEFIREYFKAGVSQKSEDTEIEANPEDLENLLERYVKNIEGEETKGELGNILKKVQREAIKNEFRNLTKTQKEVCTYPYDQNLIVNAGPGSGKTHVLMLRTAHLIHEQGIKPNGILILAFNRAVVHEIRTRLKELFEQLGYGGYVRSLKIHTFHAFALKNFPEEEKTKLENENQMDELLTKFCEYCKTNGNWTESFIGGIQAILVDEFQDMNDDLYGLLKTLQKQSDAGITVIGDDDQDILRWNRLVNPVEAREYFENFSKDFSSKNGIPPKTIDMVTNFRSSQEVIKRSQNLLDRLLQKNRMKTKVSMKPHKGAIQGYVDDKFVLQENTILEILEKIPKDETVAILCRTNSDVYREFEKLKEKYSGIEILRSDNLKVSRLRHVNKFLDICHEEINRNGDQSLKKHNLFNKLIETYKNSGIPEIKNPIHPKIIFLKEALVSENSRASLQNYVNFLKETDYADYTRMLGKTKLIDWKEKREEEGFGRILISTIHKVKGLEFDHVLILPSTSKFPKINNGKIDKRELADEARLFYVAMTRTKKILRFDIKGGYLNAWSKGIPFKGEEKDFFLEGALKEIHIGFTANDNEKQKIIFEKIKVNDKVTLQKTNQSVVFHHQEKKFIGRLSTEKAAVLDKCNLHKARVYVNAIIRYEIDEEKDKDYWDYYTEEIQNRKYFYTVLISGLIPK